MHVRPNGSAKGGIKASSEENKDNFESPYVDAFRVIKGIVDIGDDCLFCPSAKHHGYVRAESAVY